MTIAPLALPRWVYRADDQRQAADLETLERVKALVPCRYQHCVPADDVAVRYGLTLNDAGFFWESHEILEAVWKAAPKGGCDRILLRACIQIANANLKRKMNRPNATRRLLCEALTELVELDMRRKTDPAGGFAAHLDRKPLRAVVADQLRQADENPAGLAADHARKYILFVF